MLSEAATSCIDQQHFKTNITVTCVTTCRMMCRTVAPALPYTHRQNHVHCRPAAAAAGTPLCRRGCDAMSSNTREPKVPGPKTLCTTTEQCEAHAQVLLVLADKLCCIADRDLGCCATCKPDKCTPTESEPSNTTTPPGTIHNTIWHCQTFLSPLCSTLARNRSCSDLTTSSKHITCSLLAN